MKTQTKHLFLLSALIAAVGLIPAGWVKAQTFTTLHSFSGSNDGGGPVSGLILSNSTLYGTTSGGGDSGRGTVYAVNIDGTGFTILHSFSATSASNPYSNSDGADTQAELILSGNTLFGTAVEGGTSGFGTVFAVNTDGTGFTTLHSFTHGDDGAWPYAGLILSGNRLYGAASGGGSANRGTVFAVNIDGTGFTTLHGFDGFDGTNPDGLVLSGNTIYGTAPGPNGTVFKLNTDGTGFRVLYSFSGGIDGANPNGNLVLSGNTLYGAAYGGGSSGYGTVFAVNTNGTGFTNLHSFTSGVGSFPNVTNSDGANPFRGLFLSGSTLYGTANRGGSSGYGTVFAVNTDGTGFTTLHSFTAPTGSPPSTNGDGAGPIAGLVLSGNTLYGAANIGGGSGSGTIFSLVLVPTLNILNVAVPEGDSGITNAVFTVLLSTNQAEIVSVDFATADGTAIAGSDYIATNGTLIFAPGETTKAIVVAVIGDVLPEPDETFFVNLSNPTNIVLVSNQAQGTILDDDTPFITSQPQNQAARPGSNATFSVSVTGDPLILYQWRVNGMDIAGASDATFTLMNVQLSDDGNEYTVLVTLKTASVLSDAASLTVITHPTLLSQPVSQTVSPGTNMTFTVSASSDLPITYQWLFNGSNLAGATNSTLTLTNVQLADEGAYSVVLADGSIETVTSNPATLQILIAPALIIQPPLSQSVVAGGNVTLSVTISGHPPPFNYQWRRGSTILTNLVINETNCFFTLTNVQPDQGGPNVLYRVVVTNQIFLVLKPNATFFLTVLADSDHDGLPDLWETAYGLNPTNSTDANLDSDGDGMTNWQEYIAGTNPRDPQSYLKIDSVGAGGLSGALLRFVAVSNRTYTVQSRAAVDHGEWSRVADMAAAPTNRLINLSDAPSPLGNPQRFYRLVTPGVP